MSECGEGKVEAKTSHPSFQYVSCTMCELSNFQVTRLPKLANSLILAGNISGFAGDADGLKFLLEYWSKVYEDVFYVPGPQEYAGASMEVGHQICKSIATNNVHLISPQLGSFVKDDVRIIGAHLWGLNPKTYVERNITLDASKKEMTLGDTQTLHTQDEEWIRSELSKARELNQRTIVITHGCPSFILYSKTTNHYSLVSPVSADLVSSDLGPEFWVYGAPGDMPVATLFREGEVGGVVFCVNNYNAREDSLRGTHIIEILGKK